MKRILVLDGYNVIHGIAELERTLKRSLEAARHALIQYAEAYLSLRGDAEKIYIIFDGKDQYSDLPTPASRAGVEVLFSSEREEADDLILDVIRSAPRGSDFRIVSNDNYVFNNCKALGARVISVSTFQAEFEKKAYPKPTSGRGAETKISDSAARKITDEYRKHLGL